MNKITKSAIGLMLVTIVSKVLGFGRELVLASSYGATKYSDAYLIAVNIPLVIFASIGTALGTTFIPIYFEINNTLDKKKALKFTNNILNICMLLCLILAGLCIIFAEPLVKLFAFGFNEETFNIAVNFTRILILGIIFTGLSYIMTAYLQVNNNFSIPGLISVPKNVIIIVSIILSIKYGPYTMIWGTLIGMALEFLFQLPFAINNGYKYDLYINIKDEYIKKTICLIGPVFIGVAVNQVNAMVDRTLASTLVEGSISALNYANKLNGFVTALFITSIASVVYPMISKLSLEDNKDRFIESVIKSINIVIVLVMPISIGAIVLSTPIVEFLFQRGKFDITATNMTSIALVMYSIGMVASGLRDILSKVFYALQDTKTPMINGAIAMGMNIFINIILIKPFKHAGLALGTSITALICIFLLFRSLKKKIGYYGQDKIIKTTIKSLIASIVMGIITYYVYFKTSSYLQRDSLYLIIPVIISIFVGIIIYGLITMMLNVEEVNVIKDTIIFKIKKLIYKNKIN